MTATDTVEFRAVNTVPESPNRIHTEEGAKEYGFKGGLVPGIATFSYAVEAIRWREGDGWVDQAYIDMRYAAPVYDGELITAAIAGSASEGGSFAVTNPADELCARGTFGTARSGRYSGPTQTLPQTAAPTTLAPLLGANLASTEHLGSVALVIDQDECTAYLEQLGLDPGFYVERGIAQLGYVARQYTRLIHANFERVGPGIHASTELEVLRPLRFGETVSMRGRVERLFRRRGQGYWTFAMGWVDADGQTCLRALHTAIYDVKKRSASAPGAG